MGIVSELLYSWCNRFNYDLIMDAATYVIPRKKKKILSPSNVKPASIRVLNNDSADNTSQNNDI